MKPQVVNLEIGESYRAPTETREERVAYLTAVITHYMGAVAIAANELQELTGERTSAALIYHGEYIPVIGV